MRGRALCDATLSLPHELIASLPLLIYTPREKRESTRTSGRRCPCCTRRRRRHWQRGSTGRACPPAEEGSANNGISTNVEASPPLPAESEWSQIRANTHLLELRVDARHVGRVQTVLVVPVAHRVHPRRVGRVGNEEDPVEERLLPLVRPARPARPREVTRAHDLDAPRTMRARDARASLRLIARSGPCPSVARAVATRTQGCSRARWRCWRRQT